MGMGTAELWGEKKRLCFRREGESAFMEKHMIWGKDKEGFGRTDGR